MYQYWFFNRKKVTTLMQEVTTGATVRVTYTGAQYSLLRLSGSQKIVLKIVYYFFLKGAGGRKGRWKSAEVGRPIRNPDGREKTLPIAAVEVY